MIGQTVGHYRVLDRLGSGGMGEVFLAEDVRLGRSVALKFLPGASAETAERRERFLREARAASRLDHPNICAVYEIDETAEGRTYIAMAHCDGETLRQVVDRGPVAPARAVEIALQVAEGLAEAHRSGVVHRDIKPANLMVLRDGRVKILDFGLAKLRGGEDLTSPGMAVGTAAYMSPEQTTGGPVDGRTDVWGLGVVLYEMLAGTRPFQGEHPQALAWAIVNDEPPPIAGIPADLSGILQRALSKSPSRRQASMHELLEELRSVRAEAEAATAVRPLAIPSPPASTSCTVGRRAELAELRRAFDETAGGGARMVVISGEPGLGKTTLVDTFLRELAEDGAPFVLLRGGCSERLAGTGAYLPVLEALRDLVQGSAAAGVAEELRTLAPTWFVQVAPADPLASRLEEGARSALPERRKLELGAFLGALSHLRPVVVFVDDLHWADVSTVDLVAHLVTRLESARLLFVLALRPAELLLGRHPFLAIEPDLRARGICREVALGFLGEKDIEDYLELAFPDHRLPEGVAGLLRAKTEGSPLFMVGLLGDLQARGVIARDESHWRLARPLPAIESELPQSVRGMIERKLGQLSAAERLLVEAGGVQGFELDSATLARALELDGEQVEEQLHGLERVHAFLDFVGEKELPNGGLTCCYRFVHALYHDVLYHSLRPARRRALAGKVAGALRELHAGRLSPVVSQVALLLETARDFGPAADHYLLAAQRSAEVHACREAALLADKGLECVRRLGEGPERRRRLLLLQAVRDESVGDAREMAGDRAEARALYASAREHAPVEDTLWQARLFRKTGRTWQLDHDYDEALAAHARAEAALEADASLGAEKWREWIQVQLERMELHYFASHLPQLDETCARSRPVVEAHGTPAQRSRFFVGLYLAGLRRDRYRPKDATLAHARAGLLASGESGDLREEAWARFCLGFCHLWRSELSEAGEHLLASLGMCERVRDETTRTRCLTYLTVLHRMQDDIDGAGKYAARSLEAATATAMKEYVGTARANEAWIAWRKGDLAMARARGREALDIWSGLAPGHASAAFTWTGLLPLIAAALEMQDVEDAVACARKLAGASTMELPGSVQEGATHAIRAWECGDPAAARAFLDATVDAARANCLL